MHAPETPFLQRNNTNKNYGNPDGFLDNHMHASVCLTSIELTTIKHPSLICPLMVLGSPVLHAAPHLELRKGRGVLGGNFSEWYHSSRYIGSTHPADQLHSSEQNND